MWRDAVPELPGNRARVGWWAFISVLAAAALFIAHSFVGMLVIGVFGYYATRPIYRRLTGFIDSDGIAAGLTILLFVVPVAVLAVYAGFRVVQQAQAFLAGPSGSVVLLENYLNLGQLTGAQRRSLAALIQNPDQLLSQPQQTLQTALGTGVRLLSAIFGGLLLIALALTLSYFLLEHEEELSDGLVELFGGRDTTAYAYASVVDEDLESVFFGNLLFVLVISIVAAVTYWGTNLLAPQGVGVPMVLVLAFLTGVASLIPIVVGKIIYIPVVAYLAFQAIQAGGNQLAFVGGALVAYFLVLDILPQTFLQPYITGRKLDMVLLMFAYILGPILFGWYGFFFLPIVFVLMLEAVRIVLPELLHGEPLTPDLSIGEGVGTDPRSVRPTESAPDETAAEDDTAADTD